MAVENGNYWLTRGNEEIDRLNEQHRQYAKILGYVLHPSIVERLPRNPRIADIATGTGVFLHDLAGRFPLESRFDGFDVSGDQFPPADAVPSNVHFHVADAKDPVAEEFRGQFDAVHLRLLSIGLNDEDWEPIASNALMLLKPGGAMQWAEAHHLQTCTVLQNDPLASRANIDAYTNLTLTVPGIVTRAASGFPKLEQILKKLGMESVQHDIVSSDRVPEMRKPCAYVTMGAHAQIHQILGLAPAEEDRMRKAAEQDIENGAYLRFDIHVFRAFKAL